MGVFSDVYREFSKPASKLTVSEWCDKYRYVGTGSEQGLWDTDRTPYLREIMDSSGMPSVERVIMMCSAQVGKTATLTNITAYHIAEKPSEIMSVHPTDAVAMEYSKERFEPTIRGTKPLRDRLTDVYQPSSSRRKQSNETITMKQFPGGFLAIVGAIAPSNLARRAVQIALVDEIDRTGGTNAEGRILDQVEKRTNTYIGNRKIVVASTPHMMGESPIHEEFMRGDQRYYMIPCQHCGVCSRWEIGQVEWDKDEDDDVIPESIRHVCPHCEGVIRRGGVAPGSLLREGFWEPHAPKNSRYGRSYHLWAIYSPWVPLESIVDEYVNAKRSRDPSKLRSMTNLLLGEPYERSKIEESDAHDLFMRRSEYPAEVPEGVGVLTCGVDVQGASLVAEVVGWGVGKESWGIDYQVFPGDPSSDQVWQHLRQYLQRTWTHESGAELPISCTFIDSGGHHTQEVYRFTRSTGDARVYAIKGSAQSGRPLVGKPSYIKPHNTPLYVLGVDEGKFRIMSWVKLDEHGPGYMHFPKDLSRGYDESYFVGLLSETYKETITNGKLKQKWMKIHRRNEPLDCRNYALAAMELLNPDFEAWVEYVNTGQSGHSAPSVAPSDQKAPTGKTKRVRRQLSRGVQI